ncbi:unnamed protein product [Cuscuta campestris]|uniref:Uncharacterized protein n=1 Tax=Cuscuta campestris TaxID=132261 RepID=A0A484LWQ9_9ASTE|nr:unnamed protein product [Cuscuta campestris]
MRRHRRAITGDDGQVGLAITWLPFFFPNRTTVGAIGIGSFRRRPQPAIATRSSCREGQAYSGDWAETLAMRSGDRRLLSGDGQLR